jgi:hypothetical protein
MAGGNLSLQAQWEGEGMRQQQVNSKKILIASFINYVSSCQQHIKAELGSEAPKLIGFPGIYIVMLGTVCFLRIVPSILCLVSVLPSVKEDVSYRI